MKVLIWFLVLLSNSLIIMIINSCGIILGGLPTAGLYGVAIWLASFLCKKWDKRKEGKKVKSKEKEAVSEGNIGEDIPPEQTCEQTNSKQRKSVPIAILLSLVTCIFTLFIAIDALLWGEIESGFSWIAILVVYVLPTILFAINYKRNNYAVTILCFCASLIAFCVTITLAMTEVAWDFSMESSIAFSIVFFVVLAFFVFSVVDLVKVNCELYYRSMRYREKCYKKVARMKRYLDNGIITKEEFEKNKADILKNIES